MKEKSPSVTTLRGKEKMFRIGFNKMNKRERTNPAKRRVCIPPLILTPEIACERIKREIALKTVLLRILFILKA